MKVLTVIACLVAAQAACAQQVWKCPQGQGVRYSDQPCHLDGKPLPPQSLQPNLADGVRPPAGPPAVASPPAPAPVPAFSSVCPSDSELRGWETRASSITYGPEEKRFLDDEIRRARQCQKGQGPYNQADWDISRRAQEAQSSLTGGPDARRRAEGMHSAADPDEGDRIAARRQQEESDQRRSEAAARRRAALPITPPR